MRRTSLAPAGYGGCEGGLQRTRPALLHRTSFPQGAHLMRLGAMLPSINAMNSAFQVNGGAAQPGTRQVSNIQPAHLRGRRVRQQSAHAMTTNNGVCDYPVLM